MIMTSIIYGLCFIILATRNDSKVRLVAGLCLAYLFLEHVILWVVGAMNPFDITLYFTSAWALDSILLFAVGCCLRGARQVIAASIGAVLMLVQVFAIQYPILFPEWLYVFAVQEAHRYFVEMFIFIYSWKDTTVPEWIRTGTVLALTVVAHLI